MVRQIVLDTETTGLRTEDGHRIIEIGAIELIDRKYSGRKFHQYINPQRDIDAGAVAVHGITSEFLSNKPLFPHIAQELMDFLLGAELIIHNAPFDVGFLNAELKLAQLQWRAITDHCKIIDTLQMARKLHVGQKNSLDALCKRYFVDNTKREYHGALLDADLLAQVYLAMTGGQGSFFDAMHIVSQSNEPKNNAVVSASVTTLQLPILHATAEEQAEHEAYLAAMREKGDCLWEAEASTVVHELIS